MLADYVIDPKVALRLAEYIALTKLQGEALITFNKDIISAAADLIALAPFEVLLHPDVGN